MLRVPQGRRGRCRCCRGRRCRRRAGLLGLVVVMVVLRRMVVMVRVAHARAKLRVPRSRRELTLEQGQGPGAPRRPATAGSGTPCPCAPAAAGARRPPRGVQVRRDAERAHAERAALAGRAAGPGHGHHQRGRHAQRDEEIWPGVRFRQRGRGSRGVLDDERVHIEGARHVGRGGWLEGPAGCGSSSPLPFRALPGAQSRCSQPSPWGMRRCRRLGCEQRGPWRGLVPRSPAQRPGSGIL